ncbi:LysE/ArgO family amino acid transporter [Anaerosacchariphilus polymeriproducens]|uniref:Amino acid transporter n=1 Tax=Anaerosacchariphilus polymeriproducens TaxID=1812858 RepID=A0A371AZ17_9FIRM|nr:LysE family transporter [Anaerosacchariphilus polymeriproducens]RDU24807.1 amino acid transporter [Anaerosacchariphilus polymeriproducens]
MKLTYFLQGFLFGIAYVAPIGMQNAYVIDTAIHKSRSITLKTALITIFFDITLALACFFGVGFFLEKSILLKNIILALGSISVIYIGISLIKSVPDDLNETQINESISKIIIQCLIVTWFNPQAIIDGTLLLGGIRATLVNNISNFFIFGTALASTAWFLSLSTIVSFNKNRFNKKILRIINLICGTIILLYGVKLAYSLFKQFF